MNHNLSIPLLSPDQVSQKISSRFSKWISIDLLIDVDEIKDLINKLHSCTLISPLNARPKTPYLIDPSDLIFAYQQYLTYLQEGKISEIQKIKNFLYLMIVPHLLGIYLKPITKEKCTLIFEAPYIEIKPITLIVSPVDHTIRAAPGFTQGILWGLRFSCPQIMQHGNSLEVETINFQNHPLGRLFKLFREWVRRCTTSTPFIIDSKKVNHPVRLGKNCLKWIHNHPQLNQHQLKVGL